MEKNISIGTENNIEIYEDIFNELRESVKKFEIYYGCNTNISSDENILYLIIEKEL